MSDTKIILVAGCHGIGKTYENCNLIKNYIKNYIYKKVLILDYCGEYSNDILNNNGFDFKTSLIKITDLDNWNTYDNNFIGRVTGIVNDNAVSYDKFHKLLKPYLKILKNTLVIVEDYHDKQNYNIDYLIRYVYLNNLKLVISANSLTYFSNSLFRDVNFIRIHYLIESFERYKNRIELCEPTKHLISIFSKLCEEKYCNGIRRYFCYIDNNSDKVYGDFTKEEFNNCIDEYLKNRENKNELQYLYSCNGNKK